MSKADDAPSTEPMPINAPTYNELFALVTKLSERVRVMTERTNISSSEPAGTGVSNVAVKSDVTDFRIVPDLNKTIHQFTGRESFHQAKNWLDDVNGIASVNRWPIGYRLQFVRANLNGAARDWFIGKNFGDWSDFETRFRMTFIRSLNTSDRYDLLKARIQKKDEHVMDYFQPKVRLCKDLALPFLETRDHVLIGLYSRDMALYALRRNHTTEEDLLGDLLEWSRTIDIQVQDSKPKVTKPFVKKSEVKTSKSGGLAWVRVKPSADKPPDGAPPWVAMASCWSCKKTGHLSRDCPGKRNAVCYGCGVEGHIRPNCPAHEQTSVGVATMSARILIGV